MCIYVTICMESYIILMVGLCVQLISIMSVLQEKNKTAWLCILLNLSLMSPNSGTVVGNVYNVDNQNHQRVR